MCEHKVRYLDVVNYAAMNKAGKMPLKCEKCGCELYPEKKQQRILSVMGSLRTAVTVVIFLLFIFLRFSLAVFIGVLVLYCLLELLVKYFLWRRMTYMEEE